MLVKAWKLDVGCPTSDRHLSRCKEGVDMLVRISGLPANVNSRSWDITIGGFHLNAMTSDDRPRSFLAIAVPKTNFRNLALKARIISRALDVVCRRR